MKTAGTYYSFNSGESKKDFDFPFNYNKVKNISFSAVLTSSDGERRPYFQIHVMNGKIRIIPVLNNSIMTVQNTLGVYVIFTYEDK